jgi:hypothetical protein
LLHTLKQSIKERANYQRVTQNVSAAEKVQVRLNVALFQNDARDFDQHNLNDFYNSYAFKKEFRKENNEIVTLEKV